MYSVDKCEGKVFSRKVCKNAFDELDQVKNEIQFSLMSLVQNQGFPIMEEDMQRFEDNKNKIINTINKISMDLKMEYDKL